MNIDVAQNSFSYSMWPSMATDKTVTSDIHKTANDNNTELDHSEKTGIESQNNKNQGSSEKSASSEFKNNNSDELTEEELALIKDLEKVDDAVRQHEMAHIAAGAGHILSGANFSYKTGPDGKRYAVGGEVTIDTSEVPGDPRATITKMRQIRNAALAPADPSAQDRRVASTATAISTKAMAELITKRTEEKNESDEEKAFGSMKKKAENAYSKAENITETQQEPYFKISA